MPEVHRPLLLKPQKRRRQIQVMNLLTLREKRMSVSCQLSWPVLKMPLKHVLVSQLKYLENTTGRKSTYLLLCQSHKRSRIQLGIAYIQPSFSKPLTTMSLMLSSMPWRRRSLMLAPQSSLKVKQVVSSILLEKDSLIAASYWAPTTTPQPT